MGVAVDSERRKHPGAGGEPRTPAAVTFFPPLPEAALVGGELELLQAHCAELVDQVFLTAVDPHPDTGDDQPWP